MFLSRLIAGSKFGAMLDQLTDRAATMCLLVVLSNFYPSYMFLFQLSMTIDIVSHWMHLHRSDKFSCISSNTDHFLQDLSLYHGLCNLLQTMLTQG